MRVVERITRLSTTKVHALVVVTTHAHVVRSASHVVGVLGHDIIDFTDALPLADQLVEFALELLFGQVFTGLLDAFPVEDEFVIWESELEGVLDGVFEIFKRNLLIPINIHDLERRIDIQLPRHNRICNFLRHLELPILSHLSILDPSLERLLIILPIHLDMERSNFLILGIHNRQTLRNHLVLGKWVELDLGTANEILWNGLLFDHGSHWHDGDIVIENLEFQSARGEIFLER